MEMLRHTEFSRQAVSSSFIPFAKSFSGTCIPARRITALNHEITDATMEEDAIIGSRLHVADEIVTMYRSIVVERNDYDTL